MTAKLICKPNGCWAVEVMPETEFEIDAFLRANGHVWEVDTVGAVLLVSPTGELREE